MQWEPARKEIIQTIIRGGYNFEELAFRLFQLQYEYNPVYKQFIDLVYGRIPTVTRLSEIPCLPIQIFKSHRVQTGQFNPEIIFESSGTTTQIRSRHLIRDPAWYDLISVRCFNESFGPDAVEKIRHLAVLPSYIENKSSSLLHMMDHFISLGGGGYFHTEHQALIKELNRLGEKINIIWGVSYALFQWDIDIKSPPGTVVIETGGMKGRSVEITRKELHQDIQTHFGLTSVASEYGMTELMSQAYSKQDGLFEPGYTLCIIPRKITDPLETEAFNQQAVLNFIDLANIDSCAFIASEDLGKVYNNGSFEVLGRLDHSDVRGCNLLI